MKHILTDLHCLIWLGPSETHLEHFSEETKRRYHFATFENSKAPEMAARLRTH